MYQNFINISAGDLDKPIYRIFKMKYFLEMLENKKMVIVKPEDWDDKFENLILNSKFRLPDGNVFSISYNKNFYAQCWTTKVESDAMWRIYSPEDISSSLSFTGIKVRTTPRKLLKAMYDTAGEFQDISCFLGKVQYKTKENLVKYLNEKGSSLITDSTGYGQASSLLLKRLAFSHEKEVRLIYQDVYNSGLERFSFPIDPFELFDSITLDPRLSIARFREIKNEIRNFGFEKSIIRSNMYDVPDYTVDMNE